MHTSKKSIERVSAPVIRHVMAHPNEWSPPQWEAPIRMDEGVVPLFVTVTHPPEFGLVNLGQRPWKAFWPSAAETFIKCRRSVGCDSAAVNCPQKILAALCNCIAICHAD